MTNESKTMMELEEVVQYLHPSLLHLNYSNYLTKITIIIGAIATFSIIILTSSALFSFTALYSGLALKQRVFWNMAIVRALFGVFGTIFGVWAIFISNKHYQDVVFSQTASGSFAMLVTTGFFMFECLTLTTSDIYFGTVSRLLHVHHWFSVIGGISIVFWDAGYVFGLIALALEMSTPFSALCWMLIKAGLGGTKIWTANQIVLLHTFHLRSVVECYMWWVTYKNWSMIWATMPLFTFVFVYTTITMFTFIATPYWGYKKTIQLLRPEDWNFEPHVQHNTGNGHAHKVE